MYREAVSTDLSALAALERAVFGRDAWSTVALSAELARVPDDTYALVSQAPTDTIGPGEASGANQADAPPLVAYALLRANAETAEVQRIGVADGYRRRGIARQLLAALLGEARRRGCAEVLLEVAVSNAAAIRLYESFGFTLLARRPGYYDGGREDAAVMHLQLSPRCGWTGSTRSLSTPPASSPPGRRRG